MPTLAKSNELSKSALDMNKHYLELKLFLGENPQTIFNKDFKVFYSESRIYEQENQNKPIEERLFKKDSWDEKLLIAVIAAEQWKISCVRMPRTGEFTGQQWEQFWQNWSQQMIYARAFLVWDQFDNWYP